MTRNIQVSTIILFLLISTLAGYGAIVDVFVYNTEFSINPPGQPIEPAIIIEGDSIRWVWVQGGHTTTAVVSSLEQWDEVINSTDTQFIRQFNVAGVYWYYCIPHGSDNGDGTASGMASTITVLAAGSGACCLPNGQCITTDQGDCIARSGSFSGIGTSCDTTYCQLNLEIIAEKDNILYENPTGSISNGIGSHLYTGNNNDGIRRSVIKFDLGGIPDYAEIQSAELSLFCNSASGTTHPITVQKLLQNWGEGISDANGNEGSGTAATPGDATWVHTFYDTANWSNAGGDFETPLSSLTSVDGTGSYVWDSSQLVMDIESWLDQPDQNFGWIFRGDENTTANSKRFSSVQNSISSERPRLKINLTVPPKGACCLPDGSCVDLTGEQCLEQSGDYHGDGTKCAAVSCQLPLTPFIDPLPLPTIATPVTGSPGGSAHYRMVMQETFQQLHSELPATRVWGYNGTYPGPTIEARRDSLITVQWVNDIRVFETGELRTEHALAVDTCLHGPNMSGIVPVTVTHLHGGKVPQDSDGYPEATFPPGDSSGIYHYPNIQPAGILWYHDHALGITRLNVMMGLAGYYLLRDENEESLNLPSGEYEIPLAIQDKSFNPDGSIKYPDHFEDHFFGDYILVNGKVWPYHNVKQGHYRFRLLNGSNSRAYQLYFSNGAPMVQIGTELGLLNSPIMLDSITILPGERADIIVDFSSYSAGTEIVLKNNAPAPFPGFSGVGVIPNVMKFIVQGESGYSYTTPDTLAAIEILEEASSVKERVFELLLGSGPPCDGPSHPAWTINGLLWDSITEFPVFGTTEIWTWHNQTGIAHPMHMHLVAFQILDRQAINNVTGLPEGPLLPPESHEKGWKDTANSPPGFRTRVIARFNGFTGLFSYHCHILEHEDHEMMRQFGVLPCTLVTNTNDDGPGSLRFAIMCASLGDTILFAEELVNDTINLLSKLMITNDVTLLNSHLAPIFIKGSFSDNILFVTSNTRATMHNLSLINGASSSSSAVINNGSLSLENVQVYMDSTPLDSTILFINYDSLIINGDVHFLCPTLVSTPSLLYIRNDDGSIIINPDAILHIDMNVDHVNGGTITNHGTMEVLGKYNNDLGSTFLSSLSSVLIIQGNRVPISPSINENKN